MVTLTIGCGDYTNGTTGHYGPHVPDLKQAQQWQMITRYCPACDSADLVIEGEIVACKDCGKILVDEDGEDPEWVASGSRS